MKTCKFKIKELTHFWDISKEEQILLLRDFVRKHNINSVCYRVFANYTTKLTKERKALFSYIVNDVMKSI